MASNTYNQGAQVEHQKFGLGTVMSSSEERIVIKFDDHGEKKFVTNMVMGSLKKSDLQPSLAEQQGACRYANHVGLRRKLEIDVGEGPWRQHAVSIVRLEFHQQRIGGRVDLGRWRHHPGREG